MSDLSDFVIPTPKGEKHFQKICLALVRREWRDDFAQLRGRRGTRQNGVDISGSDNHAGRARIGMQCKGSETDKPRRL
ncbi:hypothetical protein M2T21_25180, partial [Escherichia coli]|nr:hypothetical protein [Escherichia coli]